MSLPKNCPTCGSDDPAMNRKWCPYCDGPERDYHTACMELTCPDDWHPLHLITERSDGPDLDDLVRLIRYLREHEVNVVVETIAARRPHEPYHYLRVRAGGRWSLTENLPTKARFVGPDGTVYDCNREALWIAREAL